jgi:CheY-like chemotaxis protein
MISVVDDDEAVRVSLGALVRSLGRVAYTFASAEDFLNSAEAQATDCLIADIQMPGMTQSTEKLVPQPHDDVAFGFFTAKCSCPSARRCSRVPTRQQVQARRVDEDPAPARSITRSSSAGRPCPARSGTETRCSPRPAQRRAKPAAALGGDDLGDAGGGALGHGELCPMSGNIGAPGGIEARRPVESAGVSAAMTSAPLRPAPSPNQSRGRLHPEPEAPTRSPWQRDRDRIIHSSAFRKTAVQDPGLRQPRGRFLPHPADPFPRGGADRPLDRPRAGARRGPDRGAGAGARPGPSAVRPCRGGGAEYGMKPFGGFDHNAQSLRVVTLLESRYAGFDGLNLTWETLEGLAKHNGPLRNPPPYIADYNDRHKLDLGTHAGAEAQVARWPTTSRITATTWTTGCGRGCSPGRSCGTCRSWARRWRGAASPAWTCRRRGCGTRRSAG